ncbi:MAG: hypothetical protein ABI151_03885, partial [Chitinophagaceae bacterium]
MTRYSFFFFLIFSTSLFAQDELQPKDLNTALPLAGEQKKLVLLQLESKDCSKCNEAVRKAFSNESLRAKINQSFIMVLVPATSKSWADYSERFKSVNGGVTLFLDQAGTLVSRYNTTSSNASTYGEQFRLANARRGYGATLRSLENNYRDGDRSARLMETLMIAKNRVGLETDSLLDDYAKNLSPDSLRSKRVILFMARMSPPLGSASDKALRKNADFFNQCWFSIPADQRVAINNNIIRKTKQAAIARKDIDAAYLTASFAKSTYFDIYNAQRIFDQTMIEYFREAGDTAKYIPMAVYYYDTYFMSVPVDSIQVIDTLRLRDFAIKDKTVGSSQTLTPPVLATELYANQLKNAAWGFYTMTKDS